MGRNRPTQAAKLKTNRCIEAVTQHPQLSDNSTDLSRVGDILRNKRIERGESLEMIAKTLRIHLRSLEAIESHRIQDLPGSTYAIGYVRAYSGYLGLNSLTMVEQFKIESRELERQVSLVFPEPTSGGSLPGVKTFVVCLALAGLAYGGWAYLSQEGRITPALVQELPDQFRALIDGTDAALVTEAPVTSDARDTTDPEIIAPENTAQPNNQDVDAAEPASETLTTDLAEATPTEPDQMVTENAATEEQTPQARDEEPPQNSDTVSDQSSLAEADTSNIVNQATTESLEPLPEIPDIPSAPDPETPSVSDLGDEAISSASTAGVASASNIPETIENTDRSVEERNEIISTPETPLVNTPQIFGAEAEDVRIEIVAKQSSWVEINDASGALLLTRLLNAGDTYRVPNRPGITLITGNAGGLDVRVDGQSIAPLGPIGGVRRDVVLEADALLNGQ